MSQYNWPNLGSNGSVLINVMNDGVLSPVTIDTIVPTNTVPLPVSLVELAPGTPINITAGDIDVQLTHLGINADSVRIGDGTNEVGVTALNEMKVVDATTGTELAAINAKLPGPLGAQTIATSLGVNIASDQTVAVSAASLPLPTGAATEATLALINGKITNGGTGIDVVVASSALPTGAATEVTQLLVNGHLANIETDVATIAGNVAQDATLAAMSAKLPAALGAQLTANSMAVNIASDQTVPISAASLPLPTGAATEATLSAADTKLGNINTGIGTVNTNLGTIITDIGTLATEATLSSIDTKFPAQGQALMAASVPVVLASNQTPIGQKGKSVVTHVRNDYSSTSVTTGAYVQLIASTATDVHEISVFDSSGQTLVLAFGAAASEVDQIYIFPGGNGREPLYIASGTRVSIKAVSGSADTGEIAINFYGV